MCHYVACLEYFLNCIIINIAFYKLQEYFVSSEKVIILEYNLGYLFHKKHESYCDLYVVYTNNNYCSTNWYIIYNTKRKQAHNKNKSYITIHTPITTLRVLIECNVYIPNYDNDLDINSVRENFHKKTEQRFHEYDKRMIKNRQKCKEKCDKDIQKIILKDKMEKSLVEKVEKGCLKCACGLVGVATSVGVLGTAVVNVLKKAAMDAATGASIANGAAKGASIGASKGATEVITGLERLGINKLFTDPLGSFISATNYNQTSYITEFVSMRHIMTCKTPGLSDLYNPSNSMCDIIEKWGLVEGSHHIDVLTKNAIGEKVTKVVTVAKTAAETAGKTAAENVTASGIKSKIAEVNTTYAIYQNAIIASTVAILVIVLVMVIIYLILRYRRKKKMNKKLQYTKLLNN
ncbi:PIR protein, putative [Plasmodium sp.]|nr:PIR protein, putative [Plasmodium sp.]